MGHASPSSLHTHRVWLGLFAVVLASLAVRWLSVGWAVPVFSPDSDSYIRYATTWMATGHLPPVEQRTPGYPLFLIVTAGTGAAYARTVIVQHLLGIASTGLLYLLVVRLTARVWPAVVAVVVNLTLIDLLLMETVVYAETLAGTCITLASLALAHAATSDRHRTLWCTVCGASWLAATFVRPIYVVALAGFALLLCAWMLSRWQGPRRERLTCLATAVVAPFLILAAYAWFNAAQTHSKPRLADGAGYSLLNYLAYPEMYTALPPHMADVAAIYARNAPGAPLGYVWWWNTIEPIRALRIAQGQPAQRADAVAFDTALQAIRERPWVYASIWRRTLGRLLFSYDLQHGLLVNNQRPPAPDNIRVSPRMYAAARWLESGWQRLMPFLSLAALLLPVTAFVLRPRAAGVNLALLGLILTVIVTSVSLEPFTRQARYRIPIQHVLVAIAVAGAVHTGEAIVARRTRRSAPPSAPSLT